MEQPQDTDNTKIVLAAVATLLVLGAGYLLLGKGRAPGEADQRTSSDSDSRESMVVVENTPIIGGTLSAPAGFPQDIPIERGEIIESATTSYPKQNAKQLSLSYRSSKMVAQKYLEYKNYLTASGYQITEGSAGSPVRAIFGTKESANLSIAVSSAGGKTLVQLSYLLK